MAETKGFTITGANHTGFTVASLDDAVRFWVEGLGAAVVNTGAFGGDLVTNITGAKGADVKVALVALAGTLVELLEYSGVEPRVGQPAAPFDPGAAHLALNVSDIDAALARMADFGWFPQGVPQTIPAGPLEGTTLMYVVGPDGACIELMQPPS